MSVKPRLVCPPDYSILVLRFTECKKLGITKGITTLLAVDLQNFAIPITNFSEKRLTVKAGKTQKLDISDVAVYWDLKEAYTFKYNNAGVADGTSHTFSMYDEEGTTLLGQISFTVDANDPQYADFPTAFATALSNNATLSGYMTATYGPLLSQVTAHAQQAGVKYNYLLQYDTTGWGSSNPYPYLHPGTLVTKFQKYPEGRARAIFLYADYARADASTCTCGCTDASGDLLSNVKNFKWAYDSDYTKKQPVKNHCITDVLVNADSANFAQDNGNGTQTFQWLTTGKPAAYRLEVGDLICLNATTGTGYAYITEIDGYNITVDRTGLGDGSFTDVVVKNWAPASIEWRVGGEMLFFSGGQDVYEADRLYIETVWINNTQNYDIPFTAIVVS